MLQFNAIAIDENLAGAFVKSVLGCIDREYPHSQICWLESDADLLPPREVMPVFYGCLDWHSAVHGHWLLIRLCRCFPQADFQATVRAAIAARFTPAKIQGEIAHLQRRPLFECPYGFAWLLQLVQEFQWLTAYLPELTIEGKAGWEPIAITKPNDYMHSHFRGLNLSRAWMMVGMIAGLPAIIRKFRYYKWRSICIVAAAWMTCCVPTTPAVIGWVLLPFIWLPL